MQIHMHRNVFSPLRGRFMARVTEESCLHKTVQKSEEIWGRDGEEDGRESCGHR